MKKIAVIGASGYLGSEIAYQANELGYNTVGTSRSSDGTNFVRFDLDDPTTWDSVLDQRPEVAVWTAWSRNAYKPSEDPFAKFLGMLGTTKLIYVSSDAAFCERTLAAASRLGDYARRKQTEHSLALAHPDSAIFVTGPIFGETSLGRLDGRTRALLAGGEETREYWDTVYKTFVPVRGLARTILANLDESGQYFVGPPERASYYDFHSAQAERYELPNTATHPTHVSEEELVRLGICRDTSYADNPTRLWEATS